MTAAGTRRKSYDHSMIRSALTLLFAVAVFALMPQPVRADNGNVEIRYADSELSNGVHLASARIQFQLSSRIEEALANGIALQITLNVEIDRIRRYWINANVASIQFVYVLRYNAVSERYMLRNENTGQQRTFATIFAALNAMGRVDALPLIDAAILSEGKRHRAKMNVEVSIAEYPVSLRYLLFWRNDWRVSSNGFSWLLAP
ncbi:MAG: DUF4390 domain-containing protein [Pseudomonadota bacterium]